MSLLNEGIEDSSHLVWLVIKHIDLNKFQSSYKKVIDERHLNRYPLSVGEIIKFGRVPYKVTKIYRPVSDLRP